MKKTVFDLMAIVALFVFVPLAAAVDLGGLFDKDEHPVQRWDQEINNRSRFKVLSDFGGAAVLDKETGLVWEQSPTAPPTSPYLFPWLNAQLHCNNATTGNRFGWRLPTVQELTSLVDPTVSSTPRLPSGHPFSNVASASYWSATSYSDAPTNDAWLVHFNFGAVEPTGKVATSFVWCVRGGQGVDPQ